jgi:error-prone DNA polymerase
VLVESRAGYQNLCRLLTRAHLRSEKGSPSVGWDELPEFSEGLIALTGDMDGPLIAAGGSGQERIERFVRIFGPDRVFIEIQRHHLRGEERVNRTLLHLAEHFHLPLLATNGVRYAAELERPVLDVFTCVRNHTHLDAAGGLLAQNSERHLKSGEQMAALFADLPEAIHNTERLAARLEFTLENLGYEFPSYPVPPGETMDSCLREQAFVGARARYGCVPDKVRQQLEAELALILKLKVAGYFLIVADIVRFCRENNIMAQGRGSAANSTVARSVSAWASPPWIRCGSTHCSSAS